MKDRDICISYLFHFVSEDINDGCQLTKDWFWNDLQYLWNKRDIDFWMMIKRAGIYSCWRTDRSVMAICTCIFNITNTRDESLRSSLTPCFQTRQFYRRKMGSEIKSKATHRRKSKEFGHFAEVKGSYHSLCPYFQKLVCFWNRCQFAAICRVVSTAEGLTFLRYATSSPE